VKDDRLYVEHILECISRVLEYCQGGEQVFFESKLIQDAVLRYLQILAESATRLSPALRASHPGIDWKGVAGFRNVLAHDYLRVNLAGIWDIIRLDLPALQAEVRAICSTLAEPE
jgi:uncharacterized protein with HEPN domain